MLSLQMIFSALTDQKMAPLDIQISGAVIDSRQAIAGSLFIALPGERVDGHDYVQAAFDNAAVLALVAKEMPVKFQVLDLRDESPLRESETISPPL